MKQADTETHPFNEKTALHVVICIKNGLLVEYNGKPFLSLY